MTDKSDSVRTKDGRVVTEEPAYNGTSTDEHKGKQIAIPSINQPLPIRTLPVVMRIWVAPWEDEAGDLHADGYMYTEIEERRWNLGDKYKGPKKAFAPLVTGGFEEYKKAGSLSFDQ